MKDQQKICIRLMIFYNSIHRLAISSVCSRTKRVNEKARRIKVEKLKN